MGKLLLVGMVFLSSCATYSWRKEDWAKTNLAEAHNTCLVKANQAGFEGGGFSGTIARKNFMEECLSGQGFTKVKNQN